MILENPVGCFPSKIRRCRSSPCSVSASGGSSLSLQWGSGVSSLLEAPAKDLFFFCSDWFLKMSCDIHTHTHTKRERERSMSFYRSSLIEVRRIHQMLPGVVESGCVYRTWLTSAKASVSVAARKHWLKSQMNVWLCCCQSGESPPSQWIPPAHSEEILQTLFSSSIKIMGHSQLLATH